MAYPDIILEHLREEGYVPKIDEDGDIAFKIEGRSYYIQHDDDDAQFYRVIFPAFWSIESDEERARCVAAALEASKTVKVAKIFIVGDNVWGSLELFCDTPADFLKVQERAMKALRAAVSLFVDKMRESAPAG